MKNASTKFLKLVLFLCILVLNFEGALQLKDVKSLFDTNIDKIFPSTHESIKKSEKNNQFFKEISRDNKLIIRVKDSKKEHLLNSLSLDKIAKITEVIEAKLETEIINLTKVEFAYEKDAELNFGKLHEIQIDSGIRNNILKSSIFTPKLINKTGTEVYFYLDDLKAADHLVLESIFDKTDLSADKMISNSLIQSQVLKDLGKESLQNFALSFLILVLVSLVLFQKPGASIFHSVLYLSNCLSSLYFLSLLDWKLNSLSISLPIILIIIQISLGSHLLNNKIFSSFFQKIKTDALPISISIGSTFIGFASLHLSSSEFLKDYSKGICLAIIVSSTQFFLYLFLIHNIKINFSKRNLNIFKYLQHFILNNLRIPKSRKYLFRFSLAIIALGLVSISFFNSKKQPTPLLRQNTNSFSNLQYHRNNSQGAQEFFVILDSGKESYWENIQKLNSLEKQLETWRKNFPRIHSHQSVLDSLYLFDKDFKLPKSDQALAEVNFLMSMMGVDSSRFSSTSKQSLRLSFTTNTKSYDDAESAYLGLVSILKSSHPEVKSKIYGKSYERYQIRSELAFSLIYSFLLTIGIVAALLLLLWRDLKLVLIATAPNMFPVAILSIFLAGSQWSFDPLISIIFSIAVGIAFDNTIFFLNDWLNSPESSDKSKTFDCFTRKAQDIFTSNLSLLLCFSIFLFSENEINMKFGLLMGISVICANFADSFLLPSLLWKDTEVKNSEKLANIEEPPINQREDYEIAI